VLLEQYFLSTLWVCSVCTSLTYLWYTTHTARGRRPALHARPPVHILIHHSSRAI